MSLGLHRTIRSSFVEASRKRSDKIVRAISTELRGRGLGDFEDADPDLPWPGPIPCGNAGASTFQALHEVAVAADLPWSLSLCKGERQIAVPVAFDGPITVTIERILGLIPVGLTFVSLQRVREEVISLARPLGIPLNRGRVSDEISERIADCRGVTDEEPAGHLESERLLWLDFYYATRYCLDEPSALVIA
jgi:hypothetical protein